MLGGGEVAAASAAEGHAAVAELVAAGVGRRQAAEIVARLTGGSKNALYRATL